MNKVPENFCILPFISIESSTTGWARACCYNKKHIETSRGRHLNLKDDSISDIFYSDAMNELREEFLRNEKPKTCDTCWKVEAAGGKSKRLLNNEKFKVFLNKSDHNNPVIRFLDLKLGNICNLKCRICHTSCSSKLMNEEITATTDNENRLKLIAERERMSWPRDNTQFWDSVKSNLKDVYTIYFAGGEPLLIEEHFDLLRYCVEMKESKKINLDYNTNGTQYPLDAIENIWPHFRKVNLSFSIDGLNEKYEYQRHGAKWDQVSENIKKIHAVRDNSKWLQTQLCLTVSILNVLDIIDTLVWAQQIKFDTVFLNLLHTPTHLCIKNIKQSQKIKIKNQIENQIEKIHNDDLKNQLKTMINFMMQDAENLTNTLIENLEYKDKIRNEDWKLTFPNLVGLLDDE